MARNRKHGEQSGLFGQWLTERMRGNPEWQDYLIYYDHGDKAAQPNVVAIKGIYGEEVNSTTQLTQVDVMVAKPNREIMTLVEIEERPSSPKKLIGDVFTNLMCSQYSITINGEQHYFSIKSETRLILAGIMNPKGNKFKQLERVIKPRISDFSAPGDAVGLDRVQFIFKERIEEVIEELKTNFIQMLGICL